MKKYMKALVSFVIGIVCILIGLGMQTENNLITYFLLAVGIVNIYIGARDVAAILRAK